MPSLLPNDLLNPELEYFDVTWRAECVCHTNCENAFTVPSGCKQLLSESEKLKDLTLETYRTSHASLNKEYDRLCGFNWGGSVVDARCSVLAQLGARPSEISNSHVLGIVIFIFSLLLWFQKKQNGNFGSMTGILSRLILLAVVSATISWLGIFVGLSFKGSAQLIPIFFSIPLISTGFYFLFRREILKKETLLTLAVLFSVASNYWMASNLTAFLNSRRSVDATHWELPENPSIRAKIQQILHPQ